MKRDMDLVRDILIGVAESDSSLSADKFVDKNRSREFVGYHISIMDEAGLIRASIQAADDDPYYRCEIMYLTWDGNDFLDATKNDKVWEKVKKTIAESVGSTAFEVVKSIAVSVGTNMISPQLNL